MKYLAILTVAVAAVACVAQLVIELGDPLMATPAVVGAAWGWLVVRVPRRVLLAHGPIKTWAGRVALNLGLITYYVVAGVCGAYLLGGSLFRLIGKPDADVILDLSTSPDTQPAHVGGLLAELGSICGIFFGLALELRHRERSAPALTR